MDSCSHIHNIHRTSFRDHFIVWLDGIDISDSVWKVSTEVNAWCSNATNGTIFDYYFKYLIDFHSCVKG